MNGGGVEVTIWVDACSEKELWHRLGPLGDRTCADDGMQTEIFVGYRVKSSDYKREAVTARTIRRQLVAARWTDLEEIVRVPVGIGLGEDGKPTFDPTENDEAEIANRMKKSSRSHPLEQGMRRRLA